MESKEYQATKSNDQSDIILEIYAVVFENSLKDFQEVISNNIRENKHTRCINFCPIKFIRPETYVKCTNISSFCNVKFVKPKTYADLSIGFNAGKSLLEIGEFSDAKFVTLGGPSTMITVDPPLRSLKDNSEGIIDNKIHEVIQYK